MNLPPDFLPLGLNAAAALPATAPLPAPDGDLRAVVVAMAGDLAAVLSAAADRTVWTSASGLERHPDPGSRRNVLRIAVAALTAAPGSTLSGAEIRVVILIAAGRRVLAAIPPRPGRPVAVLDDGRLRGHLFIGELTVTAGALVAGGPTGARLSAGWRTLSAAPVGPPSTAQEEDPYAGLV